MNVPSARAVNHHADQSGFGGLTGLLVGVALLIRGRARARRVVDLASVSDTDDVIDIGCGPGSAVRAAAGRGARVTGVDPAPGMLRFARILTHDQPGVTWSRGAAEDLPSPDGSATVIWSVATVHHWQDVTAGLAEAQRVLASGGRFLAIERRVREDATGLASHGWTDRQADSFAARCGAAGFRNVRVDQDRLGKRVMWVVRGIRP